MVHHLRALLTIRYVGSGIAVRGSKAKKKKAVPGTAFVYSRQTSILLLAENTPERSRLTGQRLLRRSDHFTDHVPSDSAALSGSDIPPVAGFVFRVYIQFLRHFIFELVQCVVCLRH